MITINQKQAFSRYKSLPQNLQDILFSMQTAEIIRMVCEKNALPPEKNSFVAGPAGLVIMGFVHPEDLAKEIEDGAKISSQAAVSLSKDLSVRIFDGIKPDLDKVYAPVPHDENQPNALKVVKDINAGFIPTPKPPSTPPPVGPKILSQTATGSLSVGSMPLAGNQTKAATPPPPPTPAKPSVAEPGWSRSSSAQPVVKLSPTSTPPPQPAPSSAGNATPAGQKPGFTVPMNPSSSLGEFERRAIQSAAQKGINTPPAPSAAPAPVPVMLHEDISVKPAQQSADFHIKLPPESFDMTKSIGMGSTPKSAVVQFGNINPSPAASKPASQSMATPRVVHYTEYKSPSPETPVKPAMSVPAPQASRDITEITSASKESTPFSPAPLTPLSPMSMKPSASATPMPPSAPQSQNQNKIIFKNYSAGGASDAAGLSSPGSVPPIPKPPQPPQAR
jgi:hypothetical protein